uniref:Uncharacterized protein n=1 Tax=Caenorhabditis japonica TaxID=281687 RepID=A0A8R1DUY0_CAEJA
MNDVENRVCDQGCEARQVRMSTYKETFDELYRCSTCKQMFDLCVKYRSCQSNCVPEMTVLPYEQAREFARRIRAPLNPCLELISACNYESPDAYEALRTPNPFLFI